MRLRGIGGSEISALLNLNPFAGPLDVYLSKTEAKETAINHHMERGIFYEAGTADWYAHRYEASLRETGTVFHPDFPNVFCTPDRLATKPGQEEIDLSIKVPGPWAEETWGDPGTTAVPEHCAMQLQWELMTLERLYGITKGEIVAPIDGDLAVYPFLANKQMQEDMLEVAQKFWRDHVVPRKPPPPDGTKTYTEAIRARLSGVGGPSSPIQADARGEQLAKQYRAICESIKETEKEKARIKQELELLLSNAKASGLVGSFGKISLIRVSGSEKVDWEGLASNLNVPKEVRQQFTRLTDGHLQLRPTWKKSS